jgi:hypothetical protein
MKKFLLIPVVFAALLTGCSKSDSATSTNCDITKANIAGSYKITAIKYKVSPALPEIDAYSNFLQDCQKDDIYVLNANGTANYNDAGVSCSPSGSTTGTWSLNGSDITIDGDTFAITSYNCATLVGTASNVQTTGDKVTFTFTQQ